MDPRSAGGVALAGFYYVTNYKLDLYFQNYKRNLSIDRR
jgi:hypothetical protein